MARELEPKERMKIPRQVMPTQDPMERIKNFNEVALGFDADLAVAEAQRCLSCKKPKCIDGCPVGIDIPAFVVAVVLLGIMIFTVTKTSWQIAGEAPLTPTTAPLALKLFSESGFILPVEIAAVLLLAGQVVQPAGGLPARRRATA